MNKEIRIAIQAEDRYKFIEALDKIKEDIKDGKGSVPIFRSVKGYKFRYVIIEDTTNSTSFNDDGKLIEGRG